MFINFDRIRSDNNCISSCLGMTSLGSEAKSSMGPISSGAKYVAPSLREGARRDLPSMNALRRDDTTAIRISNLSDSTVEADLEDLVKLFGPVQKLYLAKEKVSRFLITCVLSSIVSIGLIFHSLFFRALVNVKDLHTFISSFVTTLLRLFKH